MARKPKSSTAALIQALRLIRRAWPIRHRHHWIVISTIDLYPPGATTDPQKAEYPIANRFVSRCDRCGELRSDTFPSRSAGA